MSERTLTLINGGPGTGKSHLGRTLEHGYHSIEHISMSDLIHRIGTLAVVSTHEQSVVDHLRTHPDRLLDSEIVHDLAYEALQTAEMRTHILLDDFPRYPDQIEQLYELARVSQRKITGMIETTTSDEAAIRRLTTRSERTLSAEVAQERIAHFHDTFPAVRSELYENMNIYTIDTQGDQDVTDYMAASALRELMQQEARIPQQQS